MRAEILVLVLLSLTCLSFQQSPADKVWSRNGLADDHVVLPFRVALRQRNLDILEQTLLDVSNPFSANYGKWWSKESILSLIAPPAEVTQQVAEFLIQNGVKKVDLSFGDAISGEADVRTLSRLLRTTFYNVQHLERGKNLVRALDGYTIPQEIAQHVSFISGIEDLPFLRKPKPKRAPVDISDVGKVDPNYIIPMTLQAVYNVSSSFPINPNSSLCLVEFQDDASFSKDDNKKFIEATLAHPFEVVKIVGPYQPSDPDGESSLDVQYGGAMGLGSPVWFWTVKGWMYEFSTDFFAATDIPLIASMSWGWPEPWQCNGEQPVGNCKGISSVEYVSRCNTEFMKIGLRGVTLFASSGDTGAPGDINPDCTDRKDPISTSFPAASPWVTSVGATMLAAATSASATAEPPICKSYKCSTSTTELVCTYPDALITTGGGFSDYVAQPSWQNKAVLGYLNSGVTLPPSQFWNKTNRGYPDISALGHNFMVSIGGQWTPVDGTSCSSPTLAGIFALLNADRFNNNKSPLGFANPMLYSAWTSNPAIFHDQTSGNNKCTEDCCAKIGYEAAKGWDPVTGLGSPDFQALLTFIRGL